MMGILRMILTFLRTFVASRANLAAENVLLRQQLIVLQRSVPRLKFRRTDRIVLCWLSRLWTGWSGALLIVQPATIVRWHRQGFKLYWSWKSRKKPGRPKVERELRDLIRRLSRESLPMGALAKSLRRGVRLFGRSSSPYL
jgi:putative transposase